MAFFSHTSYSHISFTLSTPVSRANAREPGGGELDPSWKDEIGGVEKEEDREEKHRKDGEQEGERQDDEEGEEEGDLELEQRNTDSVFSELSELSHDYVESVDRGARVRGKALTAGLCRSRVVECGFSWCEGLLINSEL